MRVTRPLFVLSALLLTHGALASPITLTLGSSLLTAAPGTTVTFSGTLTETGGSITFLNGDVTNVAAPLSVDDTPFFTNFPFALNAFQSVTAPIFSVLVPASAPLGLYAGTFVVLGGGDPNALANLVSQTFAVNVVPEPGTIWLLTLGGTGGRLLKDIRRWWSRTRTAVAS